MELAIQPCIPCAELHGQPSTSEPHGDLLPARSAAVSGRPTEAQYRCTRCGGSFVRLLDGKPARQVWVLVNAGQH
jgi:hypothetical protein